MRNHCSHSPAPGPPGPARTPRGRTCPDPGQPGHRAGRLIRTAVNRAAAAIAAAFARASLQFYLHTHRLIGGLFVIEQAWFALAFLIRRPPRAVSRQAASWLVAFGGTFGRLLLRPGGAHPSCGVQAGFRPQPGGPVVASTSPAALVPAFRVLG